MTRWALLVLTVPMLGRVLVVLATPIPAFRLFPRNCPPVTLRSVAAESPSAPTRAPSAAWGHPSPGPRRSPHMPLSLDVPLGLLQILLEQARTRAARERAAANARTLARVGRR